jgi:iron complex transport system substrate-binding protein
MRLRRRAWLRALACVPVLAGCPRTRRGASSGPVHRIASQTVLSDEVLWDLGAAARPRVVAVSALVDDARYSTVVHRWPTEVQRASLTSEALLALAPDLVILAEFTAAETRRLVTDAGLRTLVLSGFDGFADYRRNVRSIAKAIDLAEAGETLLRQFDDRLAEVGRHDPARRPTVVSYTDGNVAGAGTTFDDVARAAGFDNVAARHDHAGHQQVSLEQIVAWDPEVLVVPARPGQRDAAVDEVVALPGVLATRAARDGRILAVESARLYSSGAAMLDVVARLAAAHPEAGAT